MRDQLRALAARQKEGGWEGFVVITGTPEWAARPAVGLRAPPDRPDQPDAAHRRAARLQKLVRDILEVAREEGATLRYWAPWNEPNHPYSSSPQRAAPCGAAQPSISAGPYVEVAERAHGARCARRPATSATCSARSP